MQCDLLKFAVVTFLVFSTIPTGACFNPFCTRVHFQHLISSADHSVDHPQNFPVPSVPIWDANLLSLIYINSSVFLKTYLRLSRHKELWRNADVYILALCRERHIHKKWVLQLHGPWRHLPHPGRHFYSADHSWSRCFEVEIIEEVLARCLILESHLCK